VTVANGGAGVPPASAVPRAESSAPAQTAPAGSRDEGSESPEHSEAHGSGSEAHGSGSEAHGSGHSEGCAEQDRQPSESSDHQTDHPGPSSGRSEPDPERWRLVVVSAVSMDLPAPHPEIVLRESTSPYRELRIPVALPEGTAVAYAWRGIETPRPLTHELLTDVLRAQDVSVEAVRIVGRLGQVFFGEVLTMGPRGPKTISCRPSDGIALALRQPLPTPLLVVEELLSGDELAPPDAQETAQTEREALTECGEAPAQSDVGEPLTREVEGQAQSGVGEPRSGEVDEPAPPDAQESGR
jgi:bifunctional DNase/RNase